MRANALLAWGCYAVIVKADAAESVSSAVEDASASVVSAAESVASAAESVASAAESVSSSMADLPTFTASWIPTTITPGRPPTTLKAPFLEQFVDDSRWQASNAKKENTEEEWQYVGTWSVEEPSVLKGIQGDKGLVLKDKAAHHAISAKFDKPITNKDNTLVVQYEVKLQGGLECGGAYMKLLQDNKALHADEFSNASPYIIMFGPDKCGPTNKVHFIFRHKNPKTGEYEEKHLKTPPPARIVKSTTLYTLIVRPDQSFEIKVDGQSSKNGTLLEDFTPSVNPEKEIDDPTDLKPEDWVEEARIADPDAKKPEDWDEDAPFEIVDEVAEKPADWLDDEPEMVPDPESQKPEDWDDEEDGDWVPPQIPNPKCDQASGCGTWTKPMMKNPNYKGLWTAPLIDNPAYKGVWKPKKINNPDYFEDKTPANFEPMGAIGFELWTMQNDILFDNIYIGHSVDDAVALQHETFDVKVAREKAEQEKNRPKTGDANTSPLDLSFTEDPVRYIKAHLELFATMAKRDPLEAVKSLPGVAGALAAGIVTVLVILLGAVSGAASSGTKAAPSKPQVAAKKHQISSQAMKPTDEAAKAAASGIDTVKEEANKRNTRSSAQ